MLHNTGPYGPKDTTVNVSSPINLGTPVNISHNINNLVKMTQPVAHSNSGSYNYQPYNFSSGSYSNEIQSFALKDSFGPQALASDYLHNTYRHNGMFHDFSTYAKSYSNTETDSLNITKRIQQDVENLSKNALCDVDNRETEKNHATDTKSSTFLKVSETDNVNSDFIDKRNTSNLRSRTNLSVVNNIENITSRIMARLNNLSNKESANKKTTTDTESAQVNHDDDLIQLSDIIDENVGSNDSSQYDSYSDDFAKENEDQDTVCNNNSSQSSVSEKQSQKCDKEDSELLPITQIKVESIEEEHPQVVVKVEEMSSWTDVDHMNPFQKDINGVYCKDSSQCNVIDSENSVAEATAIVESRSKSDVLFECSHCCLLFNHPKRFLIHWKWHCLSDTAEKRSFEAKEKIKRRRQRRKQSEVGPEKVDNGQVAGQEDDEDRFPCKTCSMSFECKEALKTHKLKVHPAKEHECKVCHKMFLTWHGMKTHMAIHSTAAGFECNECPKRFKHMHSLQKHKDTHKEKTHGCAECPKKFGSQSLLRMHMRCHERAQKGPSFRCTYCGKGFYTTYALQIHERTHRNEKPFTCDICDTSYGTNSSLKRHKKVSHTHSSLKPFECETCHRCFTTEFIRDKHAAREHGSTSGLQYACPMCTCRCSRLKDLQRHMYRAHRKGKKRRKNSDSE